MTLDEPRRARRVEVAEVDTLAASSYASAFEIMDATADGRSPEQWIRAVFEGAPRFMRWIVLTGWIYVLGFRLGPRPSPDHVLGWKIVTSTPTSISLEVHSRLATAYKVLRVEDSRVVMTTFVRYERPITGAIWSAVAPIHHRTEPYLLGHAASHPNSRMI